MRRLPVYLLVDCSESMAGTAIDSVNKGINFLISNLKSNPQTLESVHLSIITFSRKAEQVIPLTDLHDIRIPEFKVRPGTALGATLRLLAQCLKKEIVKTTQEIKGDYRPLVFLITDGQPTDEWKDAASELNSLKFPKIVNLYAIACGIDVDFNVLSQLTDIVLHMEDLSSESYNKLFMWLTASIQTASVSLSASGGADVKLSDFSPDLLKKVPKEATYLPYEPRQLFLRVRCSRTRKTYILRYGKEENGPCFFAVAAHPIEDCEEEFSSYSSPHINTSLLRGVSICPYCANQAVGNCPNCGTLFCMPENPGNDDNGIICPKCEMNLKLTGEASSFNVGTSEG